MCFSTAFILHMNVYLDQFLKKDVSVCDFLKTFFTKHYIGFFLNIFISKTEVAHLEDEPPDRP